MRESTPPSRGSVPLRSEASAGQVGEARCGMRNVDNGEWQTKNRRLEIGNWKLEIPAVLGIVADRGGSWRIVAGKIFHTTDFKPLRGEITGVPVAVQSSEPT